MAGKYPGKIVKQTARVTVTVQGNLYTVYLDNTLKVQSSVPETAIRAADFFDKEPDGYFKP